ncbi:MAG TPA: ABC-F family ATP-binding cassette domain-containing protein [Saprospiraceae bacterium]|nr:ABC-F family ATP-binding cassette domain-containing protein [Saprospiraceae bacterium]
MIYLQDIFIKYGDRILLDHIQCMLKKGERIGLTGRNGAGKSTLLRIMAGHQIPDEGRISLPSGSTIGYLQQEIEFIVNRSIIEETLQCFTELKLLEEKLEHINNEIINRTDFESESYLNLLNSLAQYTERISYLDAENQVGNATKVLKGLGFNELQLENPVSTLSGGWKMRIELAKLLLAKPDLLLLDEPTNHLDIESIIWLEQYLSAYPGTIMIISHDIQFLDNTINRVIEIELGKLNDYKGNYSRFVVEKAKQREILEAAHANQQKVIDQKERTIKRFMAKASKTSMAQSMQKQLNKMERIVIPDEDKSAIRIRFSEVPRSSRVIFKLKDLSKSFGTHQVFQNVNLTLERSEKVAFVGQNGKGKSTLAKILANQLSFDRGHMEKGENVYLTYYAQDETDHLNRNQSVLEVAEEAAPPEKKASVRHILGAFMFSGEDVEKKVSVLSGGEKSRLSLACKVMHPSNLIILDEPTNHLDIVAKNILKKALMDYEGAMVIVSHDRHFLSDLTDKVYEFRDRQVKEYLGDINYFLSKRALDNMRDVEMTSIITEEKTHAEKSMGNREEIKKIQRRIQVLEKEIESLENQKNLLEQSMNNNPDFSSDGFIVMTKQYSEIENSIAEKLNEWDGLVSENAQFL